VKLLLLNQLSLIISKARNRIQNSYTLLVCQLNSSLNKTWNLNIFMTKRLSSLLMMFMNAKITNFHFLISSAQLMKMALLLILKMEFDLFSQSTVLWWQVEVNRISIGYLEIRVNSRFKKLKTCKICSEYFSTSLSNYLIMK